MAPRTQGTPASIFHNAIDLHRFGNGVARRLLVEYNNIIVRVAEQLGSIDEAGTATYKAQRLRAIFAQLKKSMDSWPKEAAKIMIADLGGLAGVQASFIEGELKKSLPLSKRDMVRTVEISPDFAKAVVMSAPSELCAVGSSRALSSRTAGAFQLTAKRGSMITLPNGGSVIKSFRGITQKSADLLGREIRTGMLTGEPPAEIAKRLRGRLKFNEKATNPRQIALAAKQPVKMANHQIMTVVHTSVGQIANDAARAVYESNKDIASHYRYVATLDGKTTPICRSLDGRIFRCENWKYPLQHWNCRSTIVAVIDYEELGIPEPGYELERAARKQVLKDGKLRAGKTTFVSAEQTYGEWLYQQSSDVQDEILGKGRGRVFRKLAKKYDNTNTMGREAIRKFVSKDGQVISLEKMQKKFASI